MASHNGKTKLKLKQVYSRTDKLLTLVVILQIIILGFCVVILHI